MIILIGGVSCTGKTLMAQKLMEKYKIPYLSIDHLKMGLIRGSRYCDFGAEDPDTEMTNLENAQRIIIEGCYIPPDAIHDFSPKYQKEIISLFLGFSEEYLRKNLDSGILSHRSEIELKEIDEYMSADNFSKLHEEARSKMNNRNYFEIQDDYEKEISEVYSWIEQKILEMNAKRT